MVGPVGRARVTLQNRQRFRAEGEGDVRALRVSGLGNCTDGPPFADAQTLGGSRPCSVGASAVQLRDLEVGSSYLTRCCTRRTFGKSID